MLCQFLEIRQRGVAFVVETNETLCSGWLQTVEAVACGFNRLG